jgi:hypothetical protein
LSDEIDTRRLQRRRQTEDDSRDEGKRHGESEHAQIGRHVEPKSKRKRDLNRREQVSGPEREQQTHETAACGEHDVLSEQLPDETAAGCTQRKADGDLLLPDGGPSQQHVGDIGAGDQQHQDSESDRKDRHQHRIFGPHGDYPVRRQQAHHGAAFFFARARLVALEARGNGIERRLRRGQRHARPQPSFDGKHQRRVVRSLDARPGQYGCAAAFHRGDQFRTGSGREPEVRGRQ